MWWQKPEYAPLLHHSPNGGRRTAREGARFKAMGTKAGFPDLILCVMRKGYGALFIEMKTDKGSQTPTQKAWQHRLTEQGYLYKVCRSFEEFQHIINDYLE